MILYYILLPGCVCVVFNLYTPDIFLTIQIFEFLRLIYFIFRLGVLSVFQVCGFSCRFQIFLYTLKILWVIMQNVYHEILLNNGGLI